MPRPVESKVTATLLESAAAVVPAVGAAESHGTSEGTEQSLAASVIVHVRSAPCSLPPLEMVMFWLAWVSGVSVSERLGGATPMSARQTGGRSKACVPSERLLELPCAALK